MKLGIVTGLLSLILISPYLSLSVHGNPVTEQEAALAFLDQTLTPSEVITKVNPDNKCTVLGYPTTILFVAFAEKDIPDCLWVIEMMIDGWDLTTKGTLNLTPNTTLIDGNGIERHNQQYAILLEKINQ